MQANNRIETIRDGERKYHEACYDNYKLFEAGSWLHKPVKTVMETLKQFEEYGELTVLDLGCGVGRNSIPLAESIKSRSGVMVCVDLLESALSKLKSYSSEHGVSDYIETALSDIGNYEIAANQYDYIVAVSALEHVASEQQLVQVLGRMVHGTKANGINCIIMSTNIEEIEMDSGIQLEPLMELNMTTGKAEELLACAYKGWKVLYTTVKPLQFNIERNGSSVILKSDCWIMVLNLRCLAWISCEGKKDVRPE
ncbi:class I SAM-dependent methyltransferase [Paenibacillus radicis (ex Xue et al. 2023)]|uniref:Class I SAM-dependent methyltransferase n=1 Tax=Paenibacillus radicis (ex Xue et al. 2023) TaxID=2972489 RepID=A0ABT1YDR9_9BACL|nr:class I SAM-dependent methyltransferase [Paenibacillus radicis (ex Xue et al. 2023)]MCR8631311.1 class I SAM-dependent methyltransferase [Paenibacillus radicis (ex Xue et al. 2023)]